ncbi:MAG: TlpA family protein disulfide reductase [Flavipsychrobacter sp.]
MKQLIIVLLLLTGQVATAQQRSAGTYSRGTWNNFDSIFRSHIGKQYVPFDVTTTDGKHLTNETCKGKILILNLWFEECGGCRGEIKYLNALYDSLKHDPSIEFVAITFDKEETLSAFVQTFKLHYPIATVPSQTESYRLNYHMGFPTNFIIDKTGKIAMMKLGISERESQINMSLQQVYDKIAELKSTN